MRILLSTLAFAAFCISLYAQSPQSFQYQAVVRDAGGNPVTNQNVGFQISIISGSITGTVEYVETHLSSTNAYGIVTLNIGSGSPMTGTFSGINWGLASHFIKVEADPSGGTSYLDMGTTQLLSVPYSLYSEKAGNIPTYTGGAGIDVTGTAITNTAPDQAVTLTQGGATTVSGTYPNFTISSTDNNTTYSAGSGLSLTGTTFSNSSPDQIVNLTQGGATTITGTYPNFTISSTDNNTTYTGGTGINVTGTTISNTQPDQTVTLSQGGATTVSGTYPNFTISSTDLNTGTPGGLNKTVQYNNGGAFAGDTAAMVWDNANKRLGIGSSNPSGRVVIKGSVSAPDSVPLFEVKNKLGQQIMAIYNDSIHFFITDIGSNRGGFAVSGRNNAKALTNDFLRINADSTRIWTTDTITGFGVKNIGISSKTSYLKMTPDNYLIGHLAGRKLTTGKNNSFIGYESGFNNTIGFKNYFIGHRAGYNNSNGSNNIFIGDSTGFYNSTGLRNIFIGNHAGFLNTIGVYNIVLGYQALYSNSGSFNIAIGNKSMMSNTTGDYNTAVGDASLFYNTTGDFNCAVGESALYENTTGQNNTAVGVNALVNNMNGNFNTASGRNALYSNTSGLWNTAYGYNTLYANQTGSDNTALGEWSFISGTNFNNSTALGANSVINQSNKVRIGDATVTVIEGQVAYTFPSDGRFKNNVTEEVKGLEFITKLRPVVYNFDTKKFDEYLLKDVPDSIVQTIIKRKDYRESSGIRQSGFIAQEVEQAAKESGFDFNGVHKPSSDKDNYSVAYSLFTVPLVKAVQELDAKNKELLNVIEKQQALNEELIRRIELLENKNK